MGVLHLQKLLKQNQYILKPVNLVTECDNKKPILIIDFLAARDEIWRHLCNLLVGEYENGYLTLPLGEYDLIYSFTKIVFSQLQSMGLHLVVVFDCLKLSNEATPHAKHQQWINTFKERNERINKYILNLKNSRFNFQDDSVVRPFLIGAIMTQAIKDLEIETLQPYGCEADFYRAKLALNKKAIGVLTNDSDYVLFQHCPTILFAFFDTNLDLFNLELLRCAAGISDIKTFKLVRLTCFIANSDMIQEFLQLPSHDKLIDITSVLGNLFTKQYFGFMQFYRECRFNRGITLYHSIAEYINRSCQRNNLESDPKIRNQLHRYPGLDGGFKDAREYYSLKRDPLNLAPVFSEYGSEVTKFVIREENLDRYGSHPLVALTNTFWPTAIIEDFKNMKNIYEMIAPLTMRIYGLLFRQPEAQRICYYYRRAASTEIDHEEKVPIAPTNRLTVDQISEEDIEENLKTFAEIAAYYWDEDANGEDLLVRDFLNKKSFDFLLIGVSVRLLLHLWNPAQISAGIAPSTTSSASSRGTFISGDAMISGMDLGRAFTSLICSVLYAFHKTRNNAMEKQSTVDSKHLLATTLSAQDIHLLRRIPFRPSLHQATWFNWFQIIITQMVDAAKFLYFDNFIQKFPLLISMTIFLAIENEDEDDYWRSNEDLRFKIRQIKKLCLESEKEFVYVVSNGFLKI